MFPSPRQGQVLLCFSFLLSTINKSDTTTLNQIMFTLKAKIAQVQLIIFILTPLWATPTFYPPSKHLLAHE